ncbi:hypothetical protein ACFLXC_06825 [Chloroflexota bacterium]
MALSLGELVASINLLISDIVGLGITRFGNLGGCIPWHGDKRIIPSRSSQL